MRIFTYFILLLVVLFGITFALLNAEPIIINYYIGTTESPLSLLLVIAFVAGGFLGMVVCLLPYFHLKSKNRQMRRRLKLLEEEVTNLRTMPLRNE